MHSHVPLEPTVFELNSQRHHILPISFRSEVREGKHRDDVRGMLAYSLPIADTDQ